MLYVRFLLYEVHVAARIYPYCVAGPTLLFQRYSKGKKNGRRFYACSACRDRSECSFFQWEDERVGDVRLQARAVYNRARQPPYKHGQYYSRYGSVMIYGILSIKRRSLPETVTRHEGFQSFGKFQSFSREYFLIKHIYCQPIFTHFSCFQTFSLSLNLMPE